LRFLNAYHPSSVNITMGNKQATTFSITLHTDQTHYEAGDIVTGRITFSGDPRSPSTFVRNLRGISLLLEGSEYVEIWKHDHGGHGHGSERKKRRKHHKKDHTRRVDRSTNTLLRMDCPIVRAETIRMDGNAYEYPFQMRLPSDMPSTMYCKHAPDSSSFAEIKYTLTAYLAMRDSIVSTYGTAALDEKLPKSELSLCILSNPSASNDCATPNHPLSMDLERFPINTCCFWNKGIIDLGWHVNTDTCCPNESITVQVVGENRSLVSVDSLRVQWIETITWSTERRRRSRRENGGPHREVKRVVAEERISTKGISCWQATGQPGRATPLALGDNNIHSYRSLAPTVTSSGDGSSYGHCHHNDPHCSPQAVSARLKLASGTRDSYSGHLIQVRHTLVVTACTAGWFNTSPESACNVKVVRKKSGVNDTKGCHEDSFYHYNNFGGPPTSASTLPSSLSPLPSPSASLASAPPMEEVIPIAEVLIADEWSHGGSTAAYPSSSSLSGTGDHWGMLAGDGIILPEAAAVILDEDLSPSHQSVSLTLQTSAPPAPTSVITPPPSPQPLSRVINDRVPSSVLPSAPDESLVHQGTNEGDYCFMFGRSGGIQHIASLERPNFQQLLILVEDSPESLAAVLQGDDGDGWRALVQNLSPQEFGSLLQASVPLNKGAFVAHTLAKAMRSASGTNSLTCRHILAGLQLLPQDERTTFAAQTAPMACDLAWHQNQLEQELNPKELALFRAALR